MWKKNKILYAFLCLQSQDTPSPASSDIFPISSLASSGREKVKSLRSHKGEKTGECRRGSSRAAKNSSSAAPAKNISVPDDGIQTRNKITFTLPISDPSTCSEDISKEMMIKQSYKTVSHGIRKQQHSSSHDEETQLAGLTRRITKQPGAFYIRRI